MITAIIWPAAVLLATLTVSLAALTAWRGWLDLRRLEIASADSGVPEEPTTGVRIEMADLKERLRKLEAIATGVDL